MDWKKNDVFQVQIEDMSDTGEGIGKTDGFTWFVKDAVIGDVVEARVMKTKKSYGFAAADAGIGTISMPRYPTLSVCPPVRRMSASGHEL